MNAIINQTLFNSDIPTAWSGVKTLNAPTAKRAIQEAGLDWDVEVRKIYLASGAEVPKARAIVRTDNEQVLGTVGKTYAPVQNRDSLAFFDSVKAQLPGMRYVSAGSINQGARVWLLADFGGFDAQDGDVIRKQIMLYNSHDGSSTLSYVFVPNRVFCNNQIATVMTGDRMLKVRHSGSADRVLSVARDMAHQTMDSYDRIEEMYKALVAKPLTSELINTALDSLYPLVERGEEVKGRTLTRRSNIREQVTELLETGMGIQGRQRNAFSVYNAFSEYLTHHTQVNKGGGQARRWESNVFGKGAREMATVTKALLVA